MLLAVLLAGCGGDDDSDGASRTTGELTKVKYQLAWLPQAEFAGMYVAKAKGWYEEAGLDVELLPGGPDVQNPARLLATGAVDIGEAQPAQVFVSRAAGVRLIDVFQFTQGPESLYLAKKSHGINKLEDVVGKRVGLWFGGDEFEFLAMLDAAGIDRKKVKIFAQGFTITPWLQDKYDVMQVVPWNEYQQALKRVPLDEMTVLKAEDYGVALLADGIVVTEEYAEKNGDVVQAFVDQSARGWKFALENPEEAAGIVVDAVPTLKHEDQVNQIRGMIDIICVGATMDEGKGLGYIEESLLEQSYEVMKKSGQLKNDVPVSEAYTLDFWEKVPDDYKHPKCAEGSGV